LNPNNNNAPADVSFDAPLQQPQTVSVPAGISFDAPTNQPTTVTVGQPANQLSQPSSIATPSAPPSPGSSFFGNLGADTVEGLGNAYDGFSKGTAETALGIGHALRSIPGVGPILGENGLDMINASSAQGASQPVQGVGGALGYGADNVAEFILGDKALSGLAWSDKLLKASKAAKAVEDSPLLQNALRIGMAALKAGTVQGAIGLTKTGDVNEAVGQGVVAGGLAGLGSTVSTLYKAIRGATDVSAIQKPLQDGIRSIVNDAATKAGITPAPSASIRDVVQNVSDSLKAKSQGLYSALDEASGGRAQRFRDAARNVSDKLSEIVGLDDDKEAELLKRQTEIETAHQAMLEELSAKGYDPNMLKQADAVWKQQSALNDLSNSIRQSTTGLRPELAVTAKGATSPESVNPKTLFTKVNRLNDSRVNGAGKVGRLAQAIGQDNANGLLQHIDNAYVQAQRIAATNQRIQSIASKVGLGGLGYEAVKEAHRLLGSQ
jgi:hypothetical protein